MLEKNKYITKVGQDISFATELLIKGEVVAIPTETVYGLAANAQNEKAVLKIFETKKRPSFNPLIIHVSSIDDFKDYSFIILGHSMRGSIATFAIDFTLQG